MDETTQLMRLTGHSLASMMAALPAGEAMIAPQGALGLSGEPLVDLNILVVSGGEGRAGFVDRALRRVAERGLPLMAMIAPGAEVGLEQGLAGGGLSLAATVPLMVLREPPQPGPARDCDVSRVQDPEVARSTGDLLSAAFDLPRDSVTRGWEPLCAPDAPCQTWIASEAGAPRSTVSVSPSGTTAGIFSMATPAMHQGRGWGRALLLRVIDHYRRAGVGRFYLQATEAGLPLYRSLGFVTVAELAAYLSGYSTQLG